MSNYQQPNTSNPAPNPQVGVIAVNLNALNLPAAPQVFIQPNTAKPSNPAITVNPVANGDVLKPGKLTPYVQPLSTKDVPSGTFL
jgi:hypothetical protein